MLASLDSPNNEPPDKLNSVAGHLRAGGDHQEPVQGRERQNLQAVPGPSGSLRIFVFL